MASRADDDELRGIGWLTFAAVMLGLAGTWNVIDGVLVLSRSKVVVNSHKYVFSDLRSWGWVSLILGIVLVLAAFAIFSGAEWARWFGIVAAGLNAIGQIGLINVNPWWAAFMFAADILVIYGLTVYGGHHLREL
jgi:hypothetical protein